MNDPEFQKQPPAHAEASSVVTIQERNPRQLMVELHRDLHDATLSIVDAGWFSDNGNAQYWYQRKPRGPSADTQTILSAIGSVQDSLNTLGGKFMGVDFTKLQSDVANLPALGQAVTDGFTGLRQQIADLQGQVGSQLTQEQVDAMDKNVTDFETNVGNAVNPPTA